MGWVVLGWKEKIFCLELLITDFFFLPKKQFLSNTVPHLEFHPLGMWLIDDVILSLFKENDSFIITKGC